MKNKVIRRITRIIITICIILSIIVTGIEPWQIVMASDAVHVYTLGELRTAIANNSDIILEEDIKLSEYTFEYSEEHRRIGIYSNGNLKSTYDVDDNKYYEDYESENQLQGANIAGTLCLGGYQGIFDGNNHVISGIYGENALFGYVDGTIKNLTINNVFIEGYTNVSSNIAALAGEVMGNIQGCKIENAYVVSAGGGAAGIVYEFKGSMKDCSSDAYIFGNYYPMSAGLIQMCWMRGGTIIESSIDNCEFKGKIEGCSTAAGIVGAVIDGCVTIRDCINYGTIKASAIAAGIASGMGNYQVGCNYIDGCINAGNITVTGNYSDTKREIIGAGGIIASGSDAYNISNCANKGNVTGIYNVGGIIGNDTVSGKRKIINSCYNEGTVKGIGEYTHTGGIAGSFVGKNKVYNELVSPGIYNCSNTGTIYADNSEYCGTITGYQEINNACEITVVNCISTIDSNKIDAHIPLFGEYVTEKINNCYDVISNNETIEALKYESRYDNLTQKVEIINKDVVNGNDEFCERLNSWISNNPIDDEETVMSGWLCTTKGVRLKNIDWKLLDSIQIPKETRENIVPYVKVYDKKNLKKAIENNHDISIESDIRFSDNTFSYDEESRRIGIYCNGELGAAYDVDNNKYYTDYESDRVKRYTFDVEKWDISNDYSGHLDGKGHTIYGICPFPDESTVSSVPLFGRITGSVKNLKLSDCFMNGYNSNKEQSIMCIELMGELEECEVGNSYIIVDKIRENDSSLTELGASFSCSINGTMKNCKSDAHIFANDSRYIGGLVCGIRGKSWYDFQGNYVKNGYFENRNYIISGCTYTGTIEGKAEKAAGLTAFKSKQENDSTDTDGSEDIKNEISNCTFSGKIEGDFENAAGIICLPQKYGYLNVKACTNNGMIISKKRDENDYSTKRTAGGILVEDVDNSAGNMNEICVAKCVNVGDICADYAVGGIVGCISYPENKYNICSCINKGTITATATDSYAGGIVGLINGEEPIYYIYNNYNKGTIHGIEGKTGAITGCILGNQKRKDVMVENCVNINTSNDTDYALTLFGLNNNGRVSDCYNINDMGEAIKAGRFRSEEMENDTLMLCETEIIDNYKELCDRLNLWIRQKAETYPKDYLSTWVYSENELTYGYVDWGYIESIPTATPSPTASPTLKPTASPTASPTLNPTASPTLKPTANPTASPTLKPTASPTASPTLKPTASPTASPTLKPTAIPTATVSPTSEPTERPTISPIPEGMAGIIKLNEATVWDRLLNVITFGMYELPKPSVEIESKIVDSTVQYIIISDGSEIAKTEEELTEITVWKDYVGRIELEAEKNVVYAKITDNKTEYVYYICSDGITQFIPTATPTVEPAPTVTPSPMPTLEPTATPSPTLNPTAMPTLEPTVTSSPTLNPTAMPTLEPTVTPSPTLNPTAMPTLEPTATPTPTLKPTPSSTPHTTATPMVTPTLTPAPTLMPTLEPTASPTLKPTATPNSTLKPTPSPSTHPTASPTPIVDPTVAPTVVPTEEPTSEPNLEPTQKPDSTIPPMPLQQTTQPPVLQENNQNQSNTPAVAIKPTLKAYIVAGKKVILKWNKNTSFAGYNIYRSAKKKGKYMPLKNTVKAGTFTDTKVKPNQIWYYKIRGCIIINGKKQYGAWSAPVKAAVGMQKPEITLKKEVTPSGEKYVRMRVKKCDGQYIQVYVRTKQKQYNLVKMPNSDWRKMKSTFNFRYSVGGKKMYFRIRSYGTYKNKLMYSPYSDSEGIKL